MITRNFSQYFLFSISLMFIVLFSCKSFASEKIQVEAEGVGSTKIEALENAWKEAVRNAVGMYVTSNSKLINDDITEKIVIYSRGQLNSYEVISENKENNVWKIKIMANIDKDIIKETSDIKQSVTANFDPSQAAAKIVSNDSRNQSLNDSLISNIDTFDFTKSIQYEIEIKEFRDSNNNIVFFVLHQLRINPEKYIELATILKNLLNKHGDFSKELEFGYGENAQELFETDFKKRSIEKFYKNLKFSVFSGLIDESANKPFFRDLWGHVKHGLKSFVLFENKNKAISYLLTPINSIADYIKIYKLKFITRASNGSESKPIHESDSILITPGWGMIRRYSEDGIACGPFIGIQDSSSNYFSPHAKSVILYYHKLEMPANELQKYKNIHGEFTLDKIN